MKRFILVLLIAVVSISTSYAESLDGFFEVATPADLMALRNEVNSAIQGSDIWESVVVPSGTYKVGTDIPAGKWAVSAGAVANCSMMIGEKLEDNGKSINYWDSKSYFSFSLSNEWSYDDLDYLQRTIENVDIPDGYFVEISKGSVVFEPYHGEPDFMFFAKELPANEVVNTFPVDGMSFEELVALKNRLNMEIWNSYSWDRVLVPHGVYKVGENIPAGHWKVEPPINSFIDVNYGSEKNDHQMNMELSYSAWKQDLMDKGCNFYNDGDITSTDIKAESGYYICMNDGVYGWFSPYDSNVSLGFKAFGGNSNDATEEQLTNEYKQFVIG